MPTAKKVAAKKNVSNKNSTAKKAVRKVARPINKKAAAKKSNSGGCYFTTACVEYFGLDDNCYQLQKLRNFRDEILLKTEKGKKLVQEYYLIAPNIVTKIKNNPNSKQEFKNIFNHVNECCSLIEMNLHNEATQEYKNMVLHLKKKYFKN